MCAGACMRATAKRLRTARDRPLPSPLPNNVGWVWHNFLFRAMARALGHALCSRSRPRIALFLDIGEMWLETLLDVMELLSKETIRRDVLPRAISKSQMTQPVTSRLVSCRMLSRIATCLDSLV